MALQGFDKTYYLNQKLAALQSQSSDWADKDTADLENTLLDHGFTPETHYRLYGYQEGLNPNAFFNQDEYRLAKATDMVAKGQAESIESALNAFNTAWQSDPYLHYILYGASEGINPSNAFDESLYLTGKLTALQTSLDTQTEWAGKTTSDLRTVLTNAGMTVIDHYLTYGIHEGLSVDPVPAVEQVTTNDNSGILPHTGVTFPSDLNLDWVDTTEMMTIPHQAIGQVSISYGDQIGIGTGFLISPKHVLTSAHVFLDTSGDMDIHAEISFTPGLNGDSSAAVSYDRQQAWAQKAFDDSLYSTWPDNDLAVIKLAQPIGDSLGYLKLEAQPNLDQIGKAVQSAGYAAGSIEQDDPNTPGQDFYQWEVAGTITDYVFNESVLGLSAGMEMTPGASGSPIFYTQNGQTFFNGVYSGASNDLQVATAIDQDSYNWILGIVQQDGYYTDYTFL